MPAEPLETWQRPGGVPPLEPAKVHVHSLRLEATPDEERQLAACLQPEELDAAGRFRFERDRRNFTLRRAMLRQVLAGYLGLSPGAVRFAANEYGKPSLTGISGHGELRFSFSHSADWALLAVVCGREVGVDIEWHRPMPDALHMAESFFAPREVATLKALKADELEPAFFVCWTRKEAFIKALGLGLSFPLNAFTVSLDEPAQLLELHGAPPAPDAWTLLSLRMGPGVSAALAIEGANVAVSCWDGW